MSMECPHCKHPSAVKRIVFGAEVGVEWDCERCGSRLAFNKSRRTLLCLSFGFLGVGLIVFLKPYLPLGPMALLWIFVGLLVTRPLFGLAWRSLDRLIVLKRQGTYCSACGYDLRSNESGRCPECGKPHPSAEA